MRILMLTQWFDPEPTFKGLAFAKELVRLGHEVEVLTGFPNYPGGKLYDGYKVRLLQRENIDGISVLRVPLYPSHDGSALKRIANYFSFALSAAFMGALLVKPADVMYVYHPPATVGFAASVISMIRRIPFVYDIQDLWPDTLAATGMLNNHGILKLVDIGCRIIYRQASKLVVLSPGFKDILVTRGIPAKKIEVIYNWCDEENIQRKYSTAGLDEKNGLAGRFNIVFAGTMGKAQALDTVIDAAKIILYSRPNVQFVFVGSGIEVVRLKKKTEEMGLTNVLFLPRMPIQEIGAILALADVLLVHLRNDPLFCITLPSKTQAYMAAGRPILMAVQGDAAHLVEQGQAGLACMPENTQEIVAAVERFCGMTGQELEDMGNNGKKFYEKELSLAVGVDKFVSVFSAVHNQQ
ncbi:MAG: glycosyltransferase family 4 protein [Chlorobium sp.]|nr:glycosyltransferase family 4 protein [Chlorobium sp.]